MLKSFAFIYFLISHSQELYLAICTTELARYYCVAWFFQAPTPSWLTARSSFRWQQKGRLILQSSLLLGGTAGGLPRAFSDGSSALQHLDRPRQVRAGQPCPSRGLQRRMDELSFELLNYKFPSWPSNRGGWDEGKRKSCSANNVPVGVCVCRWWEQLSCQTQLDLLHWAECSWETWQGLMAGYLEKLIWKLQLPIIKWLVVMISRSEKYGALRNILSCFQELVK